MNLCKTCGTICPFDDEHEECEEYSPRTNEQWFCWLPTSEKAKVLGRVSFCDFCPHQLSEHCAWTTGYSEDCVYGNKENEELWLTWLRGET